MSDKLIFPKDKEGVVKKDIQLNKETVTIVTQQNPLCKFEYNVLVVFTKNGEEIRREVHFNKGRADLTDEIILNKIEEVSKQVDYDLSDEKRIKDIDERLKDIEVIEAEKNDLIEEKNKLTKIKK